MTATTSAINRPAPWYRSAWPWALMAGPAFVVVAGAYATWLAASTSDGLVADDYYKRGLAINRTLKRSEYSASVGLSADLRIDGAGDIRMRLARADGGVESAPRVTLRIIHPTRAGHDRTVELVRDATGAYAGHVDAPGEGRRHLIVGTDAWRLSGVATLGGVTEAHLAAGDGAQ